ncbi:hypothetical protein [Agromyces larvae]|uniref:Uncharacterized protein n=1 Tax=Agromyces larvae TaxID=2929802 RepID=A0ABY4C1Z5_9MICO|nr:hypothetical protein [Agromyces larvae]UOE45492.1 hypothetical protein MTO99_06965 [Agromyces larvae]
MLEVANAEILRLERETDELRGRLAAGGRWAHLSEAQLTRAEALLLAVCMGPRLNEVGLLTAADWIVDGFADLDGDADEDHADDGFDEEPSS